MRDAHRRRVNGLVYLILSSPTRVDAVWRALRPFEEGEKLLLRPLVTHSSVGVGDGVVPHHLHMDEERGGMGQLL